MINKRLIHSAYIFVLVFMIMLAYGNAYAASEIVNIVYRMDKRPPAEIFKTGFEQWGNNDNLLEHVEGISMGITDGSGSAFVSTTSDLNYAIEFARAVRLQEFYIYEIRATSNFYSLNITFTHFSQADPGYLEVLHNFESSNEFAAHLGISNSQIRRAWLYTVQNDLATQGPAIENPSYRDEGTAASEEAYGFMHPSDEETPFSGVYDCANHTYSRAKNKDKGEIFPFFKKMLYCYNESLENSTPEIISVLPANAFFGNKYVTVVFSPNEYEIKYPLIKHYRIYYKPITDGKPLITSKFKDVYISNKSSLYKETIHINEPIEEFMLWEVVVLAIGLDGRVILPEDNEISDYVYLASSFYSSSIDGWFRAETQASLKAVCNDNQVMLGIAHWADKNAITYYRCIYLFVNGQLAKPNLNNISKIKASELSGSVTECSGDSLMIAIEHNADGNGETIYSCADFYFGTNKKRKVKVISRTTSDPLIESNHQFSCGSNGQDQGEGSDHGMPPPENQALVGRIYGGDENGEVRYKCASLAE